MCSPLWPPRVTSSADTSGTRSPPDRTAAALRSRNETPGGKITAGSTHAQTRVADPVDDAAAVQWSCNLYLSGVVVSVAWTAPRHRQSSPVRARGTCLVFSCLFRYFSINISHFVRIRSSNRLFFRCCWSCHGFERRTRTCFCCLSETF